MPTGLKLLGMTSAARIPRHARRRRVAFRLLIRGCADFPYTRLVEEQQARTVFARESGQKAQQLVDCSVGRPYAAVLTSAVRPVLRLGERPADHLFSHIFRALPGQLLPPGPEESGHVSRVGPGDGGRKPNHEEPVQLVGICGDADRPMAYKMPDVRAVLCVFPAGDGWAREEVQQSRSTYSTSPGGADAPR